MLTCCFLQRCRRSLALPLRMHAAHRCCCWCSAVLVAVQHSGRRAASPLAPPVLAHVLGWNSAARAALPAFLRCFLPHWAAAFSSSVSSSLQREDIRKRVGSAKGVPLLAPLGHCHF